MDKYCHLKNKLPLNCPLCSERSSCSLDDLLHQYVTTHVLFRVFGKQDVSVWNTSGQEDTQSTKTVPQFQYRHLKFSIFFPLNTSHVVIASSQRHKWTLTCQLEQSICCEEAKTNLSWVHPPLFKVLDQGPDGSSLLDIFLNESLLDACCRMEFYTAKISTKSSQASHTAAGNMETRGKQNVQAWRMSGIWCTMTMETIIWWQGWARSFLGQLEPRGSHKSESALDLLPEETSVSLSSSWDWKISREKSN